HSKPKDQEVYLAIKTIGEGSFGAIKLAKHAKTGKMVAIKSIDRVALKQSSKAAKMVVAELATLLCLGTGAKETCLLPLLDVYATSSSILLVFPYAEHGDLFEWLKRQPGSHVGLAGTRRIFSQLVDAVAFMHVNGFCHRDLKPENVLVINSPSRAAKASWFVPFPIFYITCPQCLCGWISHENHKTKEIINRTPYRGPEVDAWSLGVILYTLASGRFPYSSGPDLAAAINSGKVRTTDRISGPNYDSLRHLVSRALDVNPATRITVLGMRLHPFLLASTT
ncbi:kinase-like domain-containing protein, partial [Blastocladiella britannica]